MASTDETDSPSPKLTSPHRVDNEKDLGDKKLRRKIDLRLCTIAGVLCSLNLVDSGVISSASVTSIFQDLDLSGDRYSIAILVLTISSVCFQLPSTILVRVVGPRRFFAFITFSFGLLTMCTAFVRTWKEMIVLRVLLGMMVAGIYPGIALLVSTWYTRQEQQLRFAFVQSAEVFILATGGIVNFGLNHLDGARGLHGWQWMFLVQGLITCFFGVLTYWWMVDFPEASQNSFAFLNKDESDRAVARIQHDRGDVEASPFRWSIVLRQFQDPKLYGYASMFFLQNLVTVALAYFLPIL